MPKTRRFMTENDHGRPQGTAGKKKPGMAIGSWLPCAITVLGLLMVWQIGVMASKASERIISSPSQIWDALVYNWPQLSLSAYVTAFEAISGFLIAIVVGILLGVGLFLSKILYSSLYPLLVGAQTLPIITIAPLFVIWFGYDSLGKIVLVTVFSLFPIAVQTCRGLEAVPRYFRDVALTCGATPVWSLWHVQLRVAGRQIFSGIRISATYIFATAATAEYIGAKAGIGVWMQAAYNSFQTPMVFAATVVMVVLTGLVMALVALVERILLGPASEDSID